MQTRIYQLILIATSVYAAKKSICTVDTTFKVEPELVEVAIDCWNHILPENSQLLYVGSCNGVWSRPGPDGVNTISYSRLNYTVGTTTSYSDYKDKDIRIDTWQIRTAASFFNVLIHEVGHLVGLSHPRPYDPYSAMGYTIEVNPVTNALVQDRAYIIPGLNDLTALTAVYGPYSPALTKITGPSIPPSYSNIYLY